MKFFFYLLFLFPLMSSAQKSQRSVAEREKEVIAYLDSALLSKNPIEIAEAWYRLAKLEKVKLNITKSNDYLYKSIRILEKMPPSYELGRCYFWLSMNAASSQNDKMEVSYLEKALDIHKAANSDRGQMLCYNILANRYSGNRKLGFSNYLTPLDYQKALEYIQQSLYFAEKINDKEALVSYESEKKRILALIKGEGDKHFIELNPEIIAQQPNRIDIIINKLDYASYLIKKTGWKKH